MRDTLGGLYRDLFPGRERADDLASRLSNTPRTISTGQSIVACSSSPLESAASATSALVQSAENTAQDMSTAPRSITRTLQGLVVHLGLVVDYEEGRQLYPDRLGDMFLSIRIYRKDGKLFETDASGPGSIIESIRVQEGLGVTSYRAQVDEAWMIMARSAGESIHKQSKNEALKMRWFEASSTSGLIAFEQLVLATGITSLGGHPEDQTPSELAVLNAELLAPSSAMQPHNQLRIRKERRTGILRERGKLRLGGRELMKSLVKRVQEVMSKAELHLDAEFPEIGVTLKRVESSYREAYSYWREYPEGLGL